MTKHTFCKGAINQIRVAVFSIVAIMDTLEEEDLSLRPSEDKRSLGELLEHIALICKADYLIANGSTQEEMNQYYHSQVFQGLESIKEALLNNFKYLADQYEQLTESELLQEGTSYWGVTYTKFEWLIEMAAHLYHHRGQLHAMLVHCFDNDPQVSLFE
ncbi:uncharacterized damage-inducible protein DinB [Bacillus oleivorans]|uniref:Uncharacterized damage-inducible protein DinB n=1 Tax=Bacillus oleivorans TaxID=1448271 RepID=A0A285D647_9BACI|nr:DinB family protein [Bacillus oleivorans]SNX74738.1 uncharacterized damage-inducible protein DinB [Bacillus oleivorans]